MLYSLPRGSLYEANGQLNRKIKVVREPNPINMGMVIPWESLYAKPVTTIPGETGSTPIIGTLVERAFSLSE